MRVVSVGKHFRGKYGVPDLIFKAQKYLKQQSLGVVVLAFSQGTQEGAAGGSASA